MKVTQMKLVNLTPHKITILSCDNVVELSIDPSPFGIARVLSAPEIVEYIQVGDVAVPHTHTIYGDIEGLPDPTPGVGYIVSNMIVSALASRGIHRDDLFTPGLQVRDKQGQVIGCRSLDN